MSSQPKPALMALYQSQLAELTAARDLFRKEHNDQKVRALNRQIRSQIKWIKRVQALSNESGPR